MTGQEQARQRVLRYRLGQPLQTADDRLAPEEPLEIRIRARPISVTMRTPGHDEDLAAGFLLTEGVIQSAEDIVKIEAPQRAGGFNLINVFLRPEVRFDVDQLTRHVFVSSSCGLCGAATIEQVHKHFPPVESALRIPIQTLLGLPDALRAAQDEFAVTGGMHAAGLFDAQGKLLIAREDVGRHNAVDKVLGHALRHGPWPAADHSLMVSGRASFEIMQKALAARVPMVCAVSAPSDLAVDFAERSGQTLVGFLREGRLNAYAHEQRLTF
ncbi:MAG: formate dehydrogenase accessory sulfurtransferase FdhD [Gammaproteobacteria bacterium]|nr:formate dehydrogenase accessory sulfurtransferase FdhD [Gammaproteobacteria bacterium]